MSVIANLSPTFHWAEASVLISVGSMLANVKRFLVMIGLRLLAIRQQVLLRIG